MNRRTVALGGTAAVLAAAGGAVLVLKGAGSESDYAARMAELRHPLPAEPTTLDLVRFATLAANGHITQPWRFRLFDDRVEIRPDPSRRTPVVDPDDHHLYASLGCAAENLALAAMAHGRPAEIVFGPVGDGVVTARLLRGAPVVSPWYAAIPHRQSTRSVEDGSRIEAADIRRLVRAATLPGVDVAMVTDRADLDRLRDLVVAGNTAQMNERGGSVSRYSVSVPLTGSPAG